MKIFSILLSTMLPLLMISNVFSPASAFSPVKVKLHDAATLPCNQTCSGLVTWTVYHKPHDILAQCDQTSCQSKEGFHMSHDQYLKGDLSLTITDVDYTKRAWYTSTCSGKDICDVNIQIESINIHKHVHPGESLIIDVPVSEPVELLFNKTDHDHPVTVRLCEIRVHEFHCISEYEERVSFSSNLHLKEMKESDAGIYIIWDPRNREVITTYTITIVKDMGSQLGPGMMVLAVVLILVLLVSVMVLKFRGHLQNSCRNLPTPNKDNNKNVPEQNPANQNPLLDQDSSDSNTELHLSSPVPLMGDAEADANAEEGKIYSP